MTTAFILLIYTPLKAVVFTRPRPKLVTPYIRSDDCQHHNLFVFLLSSVQAQNFSVSVKRDEPPSAGNRVGW